MTTHAIERTSPKGQDFIGKCINCGQEGLKMTDALKECPNPKGWNQDESLLEALKDPGERK